MTKSSCITSTMHVHKAAPAGNVGYIGNAGKAWPRKLITCCVLFAFINLDMLYPMQQAMAAERQSELQAAVRLAHVDALGDTLALAGQAARLQAQQVAPPDAASAPVSQTMTTSEGAEPAAPPPMVIATTAAPTSPSGRAQPAASVGDSNDRAAPASSPPTSSPSLSGTAPSIDKSSTAMPATLVQGVGIPFDLMGARKSTLFGAEGPAPLLAKADTGAQAGQTRTADQAAGKKAGIGGSIVTSNYLPPGGTAGGNGVDPTTGKLGFAVPLGAVPGFSLALEYSNTLVKGMADTWNYDAPTGDAGLGWGMPAARMRIMRASGKTGVAWNDRYLLDTGSVVYPLKLVQTNAAGIMYYDAGSGSLARIERHPSAYWIVTDTAGRKYYFGDAYRSSDNLANEPNTSEYQAACTAVKAAAASDSCAAGAVGQGVRWGTWQGPMSSSGTTGNNVATYPDVWNLSAIEALNGKRTTLYYLQHRQAINTSSGPPFSKSLYLYKIKTDDNEQMIVSWANKDPSEAPDPRTATAEPDAFQEKMQVLYVESVATSSNGTPVGKVSIGYNGGVLLNDDDANYMGKRLLTSVTPAIYDQDAKTYVTLPGWTFNYWGQSSYDGVAVSRWNNDGAGNSANGAQYGMLKTATGPSGATASYAYKQQTTIASKSITVSASDLGITADRHARFGPGYVLIGGTASSSGKTVHRVTLYAWTSTGWKEQIVQDSSAYFGPTGKDEAGLPAGWDITAPTVQWAAVGENMAAVLLPNQTGNNGFSTIGGICSDLYLFYQNADNPDQWQARKLNTEPQQICGWAGVAVGGGKVAVAGTGLQSPGGFTQNLFTNPYWKLWQSDDWSYDSIQLTTDGIDTLYAPKLYQDTFSNPINGTLASAAAQIGEGFAAFYLAGKDNSGRNTSLSTTQTYTAEFLFFDETGVQGNTGNPTKVTKTNTITLDSFTGTTSSGRRDIMPQYLALAQALGASPNVALWNAWDQQAASGNYCKESETIYCLAPVNGTTLLTQTNLRAFFTEPNGWQSPLDANAANPAAYISLKDNSGAFNDEPVSVLNTGTLSPSNSALLSSDVMELGVASLAGSNGGLGMTLLRQSCASRLAGPGGYINTNDIAPVQCFGDATQGKSSENTSAEATLEADVDWGITNPYNTDDGGLVQHILHDPANNGVKIIPSAIPAYYLPSAYNGPVEQTETGEDNGNIDSDVAGATVSPALLAALATIGNSVATERASMLNLAAGIGLAINAYTMLGGGQHGAGLATEHASARNGTSGSLIFYNDIQAEIRGPDDSFRLIQFYDPKTYGSALTLPVGTAQAFIPQTFVDGDTVTVAQVGFKNGDLRRTGNSSTSKPAWESVRTSMSSGTTWITEQSTATADGTQNTHNDVDKLSSSWAFIAYESENGANFRDASGDITLYAIMDGSVTGSKTDTVVGKVITSDGVKPTVQSYTYYNDASGSGTARIGPDGAVYGRTEIALEGIQSVEVCFTNTQGTDSNCVPGDYYPQADGRLEMTTRPGYCLQASNSSATGFGYGPCDPSEPLQRFAGLASQKFYTLGMTVSGGSANYCLAVDFDSVPNTAAWVADASTCSATSYGIGDNNPVGKLVVYAYSGSDSDGPAVAAQADSGGYLQSFGPTGWGSLANVSGVAVPWTAYQSSLLGKIYKTEQYRQGVGTPYSSSSVNYQIGYGLSHSTFVANQSLDRVVTVASASNTQDGATVSESYDYNSQGQLRAVHQQTQELKTSVSGNGQISHSTQAKRQSHYVYYAWETPDYSAAMLQNNQYSPVYQSYSTFGTGTTLPVVAGAGAVTYAAVTRADGSSIMLPSTSYTARGNSIAIPTQVRWGLNIMNGDPATNTMARESWGCVEYGSGTLSYTDNCGSPGKPTDPYGSSLYTLTRVPDQDNSGNYGSQVKQQAWTMSPSSAPGICLQANTDDPEFIAIGVSCDTSDPKQIFYLQQRFIPDYGPVTELRNLGLNQCLYGLSLDGETGTFASWTDCLNSTTVTGSLPAYLALVSITPATPMLMRALNPATSQWTCLQRSGTDTVSLSTTDCSSAPGATQQFLFHPTNGQVEVADGSGDCLYADTYSDNNLFLAQCSLQGSADTTYATWYGAMTFTPTLVNTATSGLSALQGSYAGPNFDSSYQILGGKCLNSSAAYTSCSDSSVLGFDPQPAGTPPGMVAPSALADTDNWIAGATILARDTATLIPTATAGYLGVNAATKQSMSVNSSLLLSKDGRGLPVASFGLARADNNEAGYLGFEAYEYSDSFSCGGTNGWTCSGGALTGSGAHTGAVAYGGTGAISVSYGSVTQASDATGSRLAYFATAWVKPASGQTCTLGFTAAASLQTTSPAGDGVNWYYLELPAPASTTLSGTALKVSCAGGGAIDDIAWHPMNGGFAAVVYDSTRLYQPIATLGERGLVGRIVLNEFGLPYFSYAERIDDSRMIGSYVAGGFALSGNSRLQGYGLPNGSNSTAPAYVSPTPNSVAAIDFAPESPLVCNTVNGRIATGCKNLVSGTGSSRPGKSFVIRGKFAYTGAAASTGTASIGYSYGTLYAPTLTFTWASASQDADRPNGSFSLTDKNGSTLVQTGTIQWPRDWVMVAIRDAVLFFGDGKLLLSHEGSSGPIVDDFTTSSIVKLTGMSVTSAVVGGTPTVATAYVDAAGQAMQTHTLQTTGSATDASLIDVAAGTLYDGWGTPAVQTLSLYYTPGKTYSDKIAASTRLLAYRPSLLTQFDWNNGQAIAGDLVNFYKGGDGASLTTSANDPYYAFSMTARYPEPSGRPDTSNGAGWALSAAATQSRTTNYGYQDWPTANLATDANISTSQQSTLRTASTTKNSGASLQVYKQGISDVTGATGMRRRSWINTAQGESTPGATEEIWRAVNRTYFSQPTMGNTGIGTSVASEVQQLLPNYFQAASASLSGTRKKASGPAASANAAFVKTGGSVDLLGQWTYATGPNVAGATHVFSDDLGRVRFYRANPDTTAASQGFRYVLYDPFGRISETGILVNTGYSDLSTYARLARDANLDQTLANRCPIVTYTYDVDPRDGSISAYSNWLGQLSKIRNYTTAVADAPTSCSGHDDSGAYNEIWYQYDDLGRLTATSETRHAAGASTQVFRATAITRSNDNRVSTLTYPDTDQTGAANAFVTGNSQVTYVPDVMGRLMAVCDGDDCTDSDQVYYQVMTNDWRGLVTSSLKGNGTIVTYNTYDLRGALTGTKVYKSSDTSNPLFDEQLRYLQTTAGENPCPGDPTTSPNWSGGKLIGRQLDGSALPAADQGVWDCYTYDGAGRQIATTSSKKVAGSWQATSSYSYSYDPNGNLTGYTRSTATSAAAKTPGAAKKSRVKKSAPPAAKAKTAPVKRLHDKPAGSNGQGIRGAPSKKKNPASGSSTSASYLRSGSDRITVASLPGIGDVTPSYDATYGYVTALDGGAQDSGNAYSLSTTHDACSGKQLTQTLVQTSDGDVKSTLFNAGNSYDPLGRRISRSIDGGQISSATGSTDYWYGPMMLKPLLVTRNENGVEATVRTVVMGEEALAIDDAGQGGKPHYLVTDHLGSTRAVLDDDAGTLYSLSYDDWGKTTISGQDSAVDVANLAMLFRFQGIEQENFPLTMLDVDDAEALGWLDGIGLYHYYGREYAAGLGTFLAMDPAGASVSPYSAFGGSPANYVDPDGMAIANQNELNTYMRGQFKLAVIHFVMEMTWTALGLLAAFAVQGAVPVSRQAVSTVWPAVRLFLRATVRKAFHLGGRYVSRNMALRHEIFLQTATEILQAFLVTFYVQKMEFEEDHPGWTWAAKNWGQVFGYVATTEALLQGIALGEQYMAARSALQYGNAYTERLFAHFSYNPSFSFTATLRSGFGYLIASYGALVGRALAVAWGVKVSSSWTAFSPYWAPFRNIVGYFAWPVLIDPSIKRCFKQCAEDAENEAIDMAQSHNELRARRVRERGSARELADYRARQWERQRNSRIPSHSGLVLPMGSSLVNEQPVFTLVPAQVAAGGAPILPVSGLSIVTQGNRNYSLEESIGFMHSPTGDADDENEDENEDEDGKKEEE